ncbi:MAG: acetylglutamate kinase [Verrucomicrobia bacterium]|jgi:acetylglutamate kinase|nr:acetylglutamate kinase [Verrucomicrobiota bacterium]OQC67026.1 MAG: Acetylglutamate kinase [Verrucomicrobia bacterium ADurb.Bin006]MDI9382296.1 acetylglutamate kinase [Verrucomicrobiota bacterium]NMD20137.1 acetylglutamate kinase [Verrucomicrobiota bacterium]HNU99556.1 acetylglutamate kinase [Verrucomicrobiota bacterium]
MQDLISKAATLLEALPYLQKYSGATFVVKYGGSFMDSPDPVIRTSVARDIVFLEAAEINPVVVHGGGKAITRAMEKAGLKAQFVQGQRVTDEATVRVVDAVLSGEINPEVVTTISSLGGLARGFAGTEVFTCRKLLVHGPDGQPLDIGFVGEVTGVNTAPLLACIEKGITPVISPTARDKDGQVYNCNADVAAARAAIALRARRLVFMSDVPGLLRDPKDPATVIPHLRVSEVDALKHAGIVERGMIPKVDSAVAAIRAGVDKVSFVDGRVPHAVLLEIFTDEGVGTEVVL